MSYLDDAMMELGIYYTPAHILALGTGDGKTRADYVIANPPFKTGGNMTIEISDQDTAFTYRIDPNDACVIQRRANRASQRFYFYLRRDTPNEAKAALLEIGKGEER